ncbi:MAG: hypothetical protein M1274_00500 [Actinobacteria bacterium]|nr:hypothetical protein [Actinomycetota bacterium]
MIEQLANVGSEIERSLTWKDKGREDYSSRAFERGLELLFLTIDDPKNRGRLKELTRLHEALADYFVGNNEYGSTPACWQRYFFAFGYRASLERSRYA